MCLTCGCERPSDDHQDPRHITYDDLRQAAEAAGITPREAAVNFRKAVKAHAADLPLAYDLTVPTTTLPQSGPAVPPRSDG